MRISVSKKTADQLKAIAERRGFRPKSGSGPIAATIRRLAAEEAARLNIPEPPCATST